MIDDQILIDVLQKTRHRFARFVGPRNGKTGCMLWTGGRTKWKRTGYGAWTPVVGITVAAHRAAFIIESGTVPDGRLTNKCGHSHCVNTEHWIPTLGSSRVLTTEQKQEIRSLYMPPKIRQRHLAERFGVSISTVSSVLRAAQ